MFSSVVSGAVYGVHSYLMHIETDISDGLPMFTMVGFVSAQVREAGERVRVAMRNTGIHLPPKRITVNLTPAEIPKRDVIADLPVAIGILIAMGLLDQRAVKDVFIAGGLSLDGMVTPVRGVLPMVLEAKERGMKVFLLPRENVKEELPYTEFMQLV
ncbi:magnesium chelatase domain-containing protein [Bacillota bacterium LCP21S3_G6]